MFWLALASALSGAASLVYQIAWSRKILSVVSAGVWAQAVIIAVFLSGLAMGAKIAAGRSSAVRRPLLWYAGSELGALVLALVSGPVIDRSGALREAGGLPLQLFGIGLFLGVPSTFLGASTPFLIAGLPGDVTQAGSRAGFIYGVNTLGALTGTMITAWWSIEHLGIEGSLRAGAALALIAALIALGSNRTFVPQSVPAARSMFASGPIRFAIAALLGGFVGVGAEVFWTRLVSLVVPNTVYTIAESTAGVLAGVGIGAFIAARVSKREGAVGWAAVLAAFGAVLLAIGPTSLMSLSADEATQFALARGELGASLLVIGVLMIPAATAVGACLPMIVVGHAIAPAGSTFGRLYAWNALGSVLGSLIVAFVLLPGAGIGWTLRTLVFGALALSILLFGARIKEGRALAIVGLSALTATLLLFSVDLPLDLYRLRVPKDHQILEFREGAHSDVMVTDDPEGRRRLWINSTWVAGTAAARGRDGGTPHQLLGHLPALFVEAPRHALGIALGTGQTFASVLDHGVERFDCVEINAEVIALSRFWFGEWNRGFLDDPRVVVHHDDGRSFIRDTTRKVDLLVLEPLQAWTAGTSALYSRDFYGEASGVLAGGAVVAQWLPLYGQGVPETLAMVRSAIEVFPQASLWLDGLDGILILTSAPFQLDPDELSRRIHQRGLEREIPSYDTDGLLAVLPLFVLGPKGLAAWSDGANVITDDRPSLEFAAGRGVGVSQSKDILKSLLENAEPLAGYVRAQTSSTARIEVEKAGIVQRAMLEAQSLVTESHSDRAHVLENALVRVAGSTHLVSRYRNAILEWAKSPGADARAIYRRGYEHDATFGEALVNASLLELKGGHRQEARDLLLRAQRIERTRLAAQEILERIGLASDGQP